jgi:calcineurin-like phosphoesterase family protein
MSQYWFTADMHFGHDNIIEHCYRPFTTVDIMNKELIVSWNEYVKPQDVVVHIGDFCLGIYKQAQQYLKQLNGNIIFVYGNHDHWWKGTKRYAYNKKIGDVLYVYCSHYPYRTWPRHKTNGWNLHGHCHGNLPPLYNQYDVGIDCSYHDFGIYRPYNVEDLNKLIKPYIKENENDN